MVTVNRSAVSGFVAAGLLAACVTAPPDQPPEDPVLPWMAARDGGTLSDRPLEARCPGLEEYEIRGTYDVDWGWGEIQARGGSLVAGLSFGPMVADLVPEQRPAGFRSFELERTAGDAMRYGFNVHERQFQLTLRGAALDYRINLVGMPQDEDEILRIARILMAVPCEWKRSDATPPNRTL